MKYIEEAIDTGSEYGRKYLELVSRGDYGDNLEAHHIVPVAYFADVLGIKECRTSKSPDMAKENLVSLSRGHHVLAHFYLAKCARKCIAVQMRNAFCLTFQTTDLSSVTEKDVLSRIDEIDREYRKMKSMKKEHKDGIEIRRTKTCVSMNKWEDGKPVGISMKWGADGTVREVEDHESGIIVQNLVMGGFKRARMFVKRDGKKHIFADITDGHSIDVHANGMYIELANNTYCGYWCRMLGKYSTLGKDVYGDDLPPRLKQFLSKDSRKVLSMAILSIRQYVSMMRFGMSPTTNHMLLLLEECAIDTERLPTFNLPAFPAAV